MRYGLAAILFLLGALAPGSVRADETPTREQVWLPDLARSESGRVAAIVREAATTESARGSDLRQQVRMVTWSFRPAWRDAANAVLLKLVAHADPTVRHRTFGLLHHVNAGRAPYPPAVAEAFLKGLDDPSATGRSAAVWLLWWVPEPHLRKHEARILASAARMGDTARARTLLALARHGLATDVPTLERIIGSGANAQARVDALEVLGFLGPRATASVWKQAHHVLRTDASHLVRKAAAQALVRRGGAAEIDAVLALARTTSSLHVVLGCLEALAETDPARPLDRAALLAFLSDPRPMVRTSALGLLARRRIRETQARDAVADLLLDVDGGVRSAAGDALLRLARNGISPTSKAMIRWAKGKHIEARTSGAQLALRHAHADLALLDLVSRLDLRPTALSGRDLEPDTLELAIRLGQDARPLFPALQRLDQPLRAKYGRIVAEAPPEAAIVGLAVLPHGPVLDLARSRVRAALESGNFRRRLLAPRLVSLLSAQQLQPFLRGLRGRLPEDRLPFEVDAHWAVALLTLPEGLDEAARTFLRKLADSANAEWILLAFGAMPQRVSGNESLLAPFTQDPEPEVRARLARVLRRSTVPTPAGTALLETLRRDRDPVVRLAAADRPAWK